jgi:endonuclease III
VDARASREKAHSILESLVPPDIFYPFHLNLIAHGRSLCKAGRPRCEMCPLTRSCKYGLSVMHRVSDDGSKT